MKRKMNQLASFVVVLPCLVTLFACANILPQRTDADMYVLNSRTDLPAGLARLTQPLAVSSPIAGGIHLTEQIPVQVGPNKVETLAESRMIISIPMMIQRLLMDAFIASGGVPIMESDPALLLNGYHLRTEIRDFGADARSGNATRVILYIGARLVHLPSQEIVAASEFKADKAPEDSSAASIVAALDAAMYVLQGEIVEWTLREGSADEQRRRKD